MSPVQFSSVAPELLADARRTVPPLHARRTSACRNLFGPVDHDELHREMRAKLGETLETDRQRWNFNFEANTPLDGDYEWEESCAETTPVFYRGTVPTEVEPSSAESDLREQPHFVDTPPAGVEQPPGGVNQENCRADGLNPGRRPPRTQVPRLLRKRSATTDTDNTTRITDFFAKRKKPTETKSNESCCCHHSSSSPIPVVHTPRKRIR